MRSCLKERAAAAAEAYRNRPKKRTPAEIYELIRRRNKPLNRPLKTTKNRA